MHEFNVNIKITINSINALKIKINLLLYAWNFMRRIKKITKIIKVTIDWANGNL